ncbi:MAG TPA: glycosyltransferase family 1 protein [Gemmataceae bacterium]|nr:glycosyltransferase family 1 protein [Gemmataceae bacterium]
MRVVINASAVVGPRTGVGHYTVELVRALAATGQVGITLYPHPLLAKLRTRLGGGPRPAEPALAGAAPGPRPLWRRAARVPFRWAWRALIEQEARQAFHPRRTDLYHEPNFFPLPTRLPTVVTVHDLSAVLQPEWHPADRVAEFQSKFLPRVRDVAHVLTDSDSARDEIVRTLGLPADRVTRAYPGVRPALRPVRADAVDAVRCRLGLPPAYLLHVGTLEPRKNLLMLLRAYTDLAAELRERCPLVLVGPWGWRFEELAAYYDGVARHRNVIHLGYADEADLPALYSGARALVFPTWYEGFGLPAAEMMACGGAVIASSTPAVAEVLGPCGTLVDPADAGGWHDAMATAIREPDWSALLARGAVERAAQFTWKACARDTLAAYRAALDGNP